MSAEGPLPLLRVFLNHASEDKPIVRVLNNRLKDDGVDPWLDEEKLLAGHDWEREIRRAVNDSHAVIVCLSNSSVTKEGNVQKELRYALDVAQKMPEGRIFLIPLRLAECTVPDSLQDLNLHWVDYYTSQGHYRLMLSLQEIARQKGLSIPRAELEEEVPLLGSVLMIRPEKDGKPYNAGPAQWFIRLEVETTEYVTECQGLIIDLRRIENNEDFEGEYVSRFEPSVLSWNDNLFEPIELNPGELPRYLDLVWRAHADPPIPEDELRVSSSRDIGRRNTTSETWGMRQDFIPLKPGSYQLTVRLKAEGYTSLILNYRLLWPGVGRENEIHLVETV